MARADRLVHDIGAEDSWRLQNNCLTRHHLCAESSYNNNQ
ncbi:hypothetical protein HMPREF3226_02196 [Prevotella corporis]|uniref:Uncharacterized protein n=1 Tax=Prevotella corporis TaxID=28128 RepID=A0A133PXJ0_9BACT|nr:hypothetical protein HMPREF3226_02196 [Prevotella corporis]